MSDLKNNDLLVDLRTARGFSLVADSNDDVYRLGETNVKTGHILQWPVLPDLLVSLDTGECVGVAFSVADQRAEAVRRVARLWNPIRWTLTGREHSAYEGTFSGLGTSLPYISIWFDEPRIAVAELAQLGPESFSWLAADNNTCPIGLVVHDYLEVLDDFGTHVIPPEWAG